MTGDHNAQSPAMPVSVAGGATFAVSSTQTNSTLVDGEIEDDVNDDAEAAAFPVVSDTPDSVGRVIMKSDELVPVPPREVTVIGPVTAPAGTAAEIDVSSITMKDAAVPAKRTAVVPVRLTPVIVTSSCEAPLRGSKLSTTGAEGGGPVGIGNGRAVAAAAR